MNINPEQPESTGDKRMITLFLNCLDTDYPPMERLLSIAYGECECLRPLPEFRMLRSRWRIRSLFLHDALVEGTCQNIAFMAETAPVFIPSSIKSVAVSLDRVLRYWLTESGYRPIPVDLPHYAPPELFEPITEAARKRLMLPRAPLPASLGAPQPKGVSHVR